jgi:hypothetical protein
MQFPSLGNHFRLPRNNPGNIIMMAYAFYYFSFVAFSLPAGGGW